jgi:hypothetical protein
MWSANTGYSDETSTGKCRKDIGNVLETRQPKISKLVGSTVLVGLMAAAGALSTGTTAFASSTAAPHAHIALQKATLHQEIAIGHILRSGKKGEVTPDAGATCGEDYIDYYAESGRRAIVYSGYTLWGDYEGDFFYWDVAVHDEAGAGTRYYYGVPAEQGGGLQYWNIPTGWLTSHSVTGGSWAAVTESNVSLTDGDTCGFPVPYLSNTVDLYN